MNREYIEHLQRKHFIKLKEASKLAGKPNTRIESKINQKKNNVSSAYVWDCVCLCVCVSEWVSVCVCTRKKANGACFVYAAAVAMDFFSLFIRWLLHVHRVLLEVLPIWNVCVCFFLDSCVFQRKTNNGGLFALTPTILILLCIYIFILLFNCRHNLIWISDSIHMMFYSFAFSIQFQLDELFITIKRARFWMKCHLMRRICFSFNSNQDNQNGKKSIKYFIHT